MKVIHHKADGKTGRFNQQTGKSNRTTDKVPAKLFVSLSLIWRQGLPRGPVRVIAGQFAAVAQR